MNGYQGPFRFASPDAGGPTVAQNEGNRPSSAMGIIPFRRATTPRVAIIQTTTGTMSTSQQPTQITIEGTGYMTRLSLDVTVTTAGNAAATAYNEDAPWNFFSSIVLSDVSGELTNVNGYMQYLFNIYGGYFSPGGPLLRSSTDTNLFNLVSGAGATGGSFRFHLIIPVAINDRNFLGLVGNQDRAVKYALRDDINASTALYSVAPTNPGTITIARHYYSVTVPGQTNAQGVPQQIRPPKFGVQHFQTTNINANAPAGSSTIPHLLPRLGNTIRLLILVFRSNGSRATAETNLPTRISFLIGDTPIFSESAAERRWLMFQRYSFDTTAAQAQGVLVYDFLQDVINQAGSELGLDYIWSNGVVNARFDITYPAGFGSTNNSLEVGTDDLIVPDDIDLYAAD